MNAPRRPYLVVGYDGSPQARAAVALAVRRAAHSGVVHIVHACPTTPQLLETTVVASAIDHRREGHALLDGLLVSNDELLSCQFETELVEGSPADALVRIAAEHDADEIVVGSRGVGRIHGLLSSVAHGLLAKSDRPVLVVPPAAVGTDDRRRRSAHAS
jgi:nucleotide-binding universal stress UspA family protein